MELAPKLLFSRKQAAEILDVSLASIQELLHRGLLRGIRMGNEVKIHRDELERFARKGAPQIWAPKRDGKTVRAHVVRNPGSAVA
jgi:excisionase family DNA binding protein